MCLIETVKEYSMNKVGYGLRGKIWFGAFEDGNDAICVGNFDMPAERAPEGTNDWVWKCEKIYRATQNMFDSWSLTEVELKKFYGDVTKEDGADWIYPTNMKGNRARDGKPIGHRSMSVGDVVQFGRDDDKKTYWAVAGFGFTELTYDEYCKWLDTDSRDRDMFVRDIVKAKRVVELIEKEKEAAC